MVSARPDCSLSGSFRANCILRSSKQTRIRRGRFAAYIAELSLLVTDAPYIETRPDRARGQPWEILRSKSSLLRGLHLNPTLGLIDNAEMSTKDSNRLARGCNGEVGKLACTLSLVGCVPNWRLFRLFIYISKVIYQAR